MAVLAGACTVGVVDRPDSADDDRPGTTVAPDAAPGTVPVGNPGTLAPAPTSQPPPPRPDRLEIETLIAFLDACATADDLVGPCHCAAARLEAGLTAVDFEVIEDRMTGALTYPPELAADLVDCRSAPRPPAWDPAAVERYVEACTVGDDRLARMCRCSLEPAQDLVPEHRLDDFLASSEVRPDTVDLLNLCL